jgi:hypothetical protein
MPPQNLTSPNRSDFVWKVIGRFDTYIDGTNKKATVLVAFNTFVLGTIVLKWKDLQQILAGHPRSLLVAAVFITVAAIGTLVGLGLAFLAIHPFLKSFKKPGDYHSNLFFVHVAEHPTGADYRAAVIKADSECDITDLCHQAHILACGLTSKMTRLQISFWATILALGMIAGVLVCLFIAFIM